ncbi:hypothetical protein GCG54_00005629 [Colletotrichum gloeosporioides]|uniref:Uncharacterized protein n=1 Tax=Colletotrichum gloeosporioides TaxID=474922 RepID=A0A8H4CKF1_COLGL|nr:uncharacterized protein GCG54_00005629 [Colletotrichum gloeosporioides]KAF3805590.1 hypothetical protein GCG54_00005629 [Colletotrichum gloeosporioides]
MELAMDAVVTAAKRAFKDAHAEWYEEKERQEQKGGQIEDVAIDAVAIQKAQELRDLKDALRNLRAEEAEGSRDVPDVERVRDALKVVRAQRHREAKEHRPER